MWTSILAQSFYERDPDIVAKELLGKLLARRIEYQLIGGMIVETEAYYGRSDPASRAHQGRKIHNRLMWGEPGRSFIYNVHKYWMFNVVAHKKNETGAILIRAIEPTIGTEVMKRHRPVSRLVDLTNGPGKLTMALKIDKSLNGMPVTSTEGEIVIIDNDIEFEMQSSHRIGVTRDLEKELRFFIDGNKSVSRP